MSPVADSTLFDSAAYRLLHFPEVLVLLASLPRTHDAHRPAGSGDAAAAAPTAERRASASVPIDILETPKEYTFFLDVPGLSKSDIQVTLDDEKTLVIKSRGKRQRDEAEGEGCKYLRLERRAPPKFLRMFRLPDYSRHVSRRRQVRERCAHCGRRRSRHRRPRRRR